MSTKMTGLDDLGMVTTAGDTGTLVTDGSLTIGNADTDNVVFNADIDSALVPNQDGIFGLGTSSKSWKDLHIGTSFYLYDGSPYSIALNWDPPSQNVQLTIPAVDGVLAVEGLLPSYLPFGKNASQNAPITDYELTTVNGSQNAQGWRMPVDGLVTNMSCQLVAAASGSSNSFLLTLWKNGVKQVGYDILLNNVPTGDGGATVAFANPLPFVANDRILLRVSLTAGAGATLSVGDVACLLRILN